MATSLKLCDLIRPFESANGDFALWIERLEVVAELRGEATGELRKILPCFLGGEAFGVYKELPNSVRAEYEKVKAALLAAFGP